MVVFTDMCSFVTAGCQEVRYFHVEDIDSAQEGPVLPRCRDRAADFPRSLRWPSRSQERISKSCAGHTARARAEPHDAADRVLVRCPVSEGNPESCAAEAHEGADHGRAHVTCRIARRSRSWTCPLCSVRKHIDVEPVPHCSSESVELVRLTPREQVHKRNEQNLNVSVAKILTTQERISERILIRNARRLLKCPRFQATFCCE